VIVRAVALELGGDCGAACWRRTNGSAGRLGSIKGVKRVTPDPSGRGISGDDTVMTTAPAVRDIGMADLSDSDDDSDEEGVPGDDTVMTTAPVEHQP